MKYAMWSALSLILGIGCVDPDLADRGTPPPRGSFKADGIFSCRGSCGGQSPGGCWCDARCASFGDCCVDKVTVCDGAQPSCAGYCGMKSPFGCFCDALCEKHGDCCFDKRTSCAGEKKDAGVNKDGDADSSTGYPKPDTYPWSKMDAYSWSDTGYPSMDAYSWPDWGYPKMDAYSWPDTGYPSMDAYSWPDAGYPSMDAYVWPDAGYPSMDAYP